MRSFRSPSPFSLSAPAPSSRGMALLDAWRDGNSYMDCEDDDDKMHSEC